MFSQISNVTVRPHPVNVCIDQTCIATALLQLAKGDWDRNWIRRVLRRQRVCAVTP